ncbi:MAG: single-stranded DNA-binding protein [Kiritimatiellae bacterium]|jgi:single-strand DNA-binding protein|nr:single-stranded DNA-binding protein [Kiritimatiellia bacterium]
MANMNRVFLAGNLTRDPEIRYTQAGKAIADLTLAVNRRYKTSSGEAKEDVCFVNVVAWERQAELAGEYLRKGSSVLIEGALRLDQWETNGEKRSRLRVVADRIQFLDRLKRSEVGDAPENSAAHEPAAPAGESEPLPPSGEKADADNLPF